MPFSSISNLPASVKDHLPAHAQQIYKKAFNSAYDEYKNQADSKGDDDREATAHKVAWSAVKKAGYHKNDNGTWQKE